MDLVTRTWPTTTPGVLELPSGRLVRGTRVVESRTGEHGADYSLYLYGHQPDPPAWDWTWIHWPDFWLPRDPRSALATLREAHARAAEERVEVACGGGIGRTGTALSALAVLDGLTPREAVRWVRSRYHPRAVEMPWQRLFIRSAAAAASEKA